MHRLDEGERGEAAPRRLSGRGLAYWDDGGSGRIIYITPGYHLITLDAATGDRVTGFGTNGIVDLKQGMDQEIDPITGEVGLHATPTVAGDTIIVGAAHLPGGAPASMKNVKGYVRGFDARTGERRWIFHTIPGADEFGNDTWLNDSWRYTGNAGVWGQISVDEELGIVYLPTEMPTNDYYGAIATATICSPTASWRWISRPASGSGTSSSSITTSGIGTYRARRSLRMCGSRAVRA